MDSLQALQTLRPEIRSEEAAHSELTGTIHLTEEIIPALQVLDDAGNLKSFRNSEGQRILPETAARGCDYRITVDTSGTGYFETTEAFVRVNQDGPPATYFIWHKDDQFDAAYEDTVRLIQLLRQVADHYNQATRKLIFVAGHTLDIKLAYTANDVRSLPNLKELCAEMAGVTDPQTKKLLFKTALSETLKGDLADQRLPALLRKFGPFYSNFSHSYLLYLQQFSLDKVHKAYEEKKLKYISDLNGIISGVQSGILGVPIAYFILSEKLTPASNFTVKNAVLTTAGLAFCGMLILVTFNQRRTLNAIKASIDDAEEELATSFQDRFEKVKAMITQAKNQADFVGKILTTAQCAISFFSLLLVVVLIYMSTPSLQAWLAWSASITSESQPKSGPSSKGN